MSYKCTTNSNQRVQSDPQFRDDLDLAVSSLHSEASRRARSSLKTNDDWIYYQPCKAGPPIIRGPQLKLDVNFNNLVGLDLVSSCLAAPRSSTICQLARQLLQNT